MGVWELEGRVGNGEACWNWRGVLETREADTLLDQAAPSPSIRRQALICPRCIIMWPPQ